jgi:plastocyanin
MRVVAAVALLTGGLVHLDLYFRYGYRDITEGNVGRAFLANGIAAVVLAALLLVRRELLIRIAGLLLAVGTLISFVMSRTLDDGFFGFTEQGMQPSPQATIALVAEIVAIVVLAASLVPALRWRQQTVVSPVVGYGLALVFVAVGVGAGALWANTGDSSTTDRGGSDGTTVTSPTGDGGVAASDAVTIKGFAFNPAEIDVTVGGTVTWTNEDGATHTVKSADDAFTESAGLDQGASFSHTFDQAGTFAYICGIHKAMKGTVVVSG